MSVRALNLFSNKETLNDHILLHCTLAMNHITSNMEPVCSLSLLQIPETISEQTANMADGFGGFSPWSPGPSALDLRCSSTSWLEHVVEKDCVYSPRGSQEAKAERRDRVPQCLSRVQGLTYPHLLEGPPSSDHSKLQIELWTHRPLGNINI